MFVGILFYFMLTVFIKLKLEELLDALLLKEVQHNKVLVFLFAFRNHFVFEVFLGIIHKKSNLAFTNKMIMLISINK